MSEFWYFVADIGGTNARLSVFHGRKMVDLTVHDTRQNESLIDVIHAYCADHFPTPPKAAIVAVAGPVSNNCFRLTNANLSFSGDDLRRATRAEQAFVINDFTAAAWSTLAVGGDDILPLYNAAMPTPGNRLIIGPGTGLGVGALICNQGQYVNAAGEGGHIGLGPRSLYEAEVFAALRKIWPEVFFADNLAVEAEALLGGTAIPYVHQAVQMVEGIAPTPIETYEIFQTGQHAPTSPAGKTVTIFKTHLAQVAGDLGLAFGAHGGIYLVGGIALKNQWLFDDEFLAAFRAGGRFTPHRTDLNLYLVNNPQFGLLGAREYIDQVG